jgi:hypothetical protein
MAAKPPDSNEDPNSSPKSDSDDELEQRHLLGQLFAALTTRYRDEAGNLCIGVTRQVLIESLHTTRTGLNRILDLLRQEITPLGLELVEYRLGRETHYCIRTLYGVPSELSDPEYAVLGVIIASIEGSQTRRRKQQIRVKDLESVIVARGRLSRYQLDKIIRRLGNLGYITRAASRISYGPRTELEFDEERRQAITNAATIFLSSTSQATSEDGET